MNDRIRELAKQTGSYYTAGSDPTFEGFDFSPAQLQQFAELIVRECAARIQGCHLAEGYDPKLVGDFELGYERAIDKAARQVLLHFEIKK